MDVAAALAEIEAIKGALVSVCDDLMTEAERGLALVAASPPDHGALTDVLSQILALCAFQDLAGQRLDRLAGGLVGAEVDARPDANLLHGPADADGLDQAASDALFDARSVGSVLR